MLSVKRNNKKAKQQLNKVENMYVKGNTKNIKSVNKNVTFGIIQDSSILLYNFYQEHPFFFHHTGIHVACHPVGSESQKLGPT